MPPCFLAPCLTTCTHRFRSDRYVVQLREVLASKSKIFIVLELITGGELFDKLVTEGRCVGYVCVKEREEIERRREPVWSPTDGAWAD